MLANEQLTDLLTACKLASSGRWQVLDTDIVTDYGKTVVRGTDGFQENTDFEVASYTDEDAFGVLKKYDADFMCKACPAVVQELVEEVIRCRESSDKWCFSVYRQADR